MEAYFVRTLGVHRVYNSAFMIMLRDEDNAQYRLIVKNTLEFDPEILKRYVNFMNNPDERTAVDQFGKGDKYFGICTMMATMPGLPMFGHGQVEGFAERYGMEYRRAYHDEVPDAGLVARHERQIAPLLHRRELFALSHDFRLYDFFTDEGWVNEDVFAYSNRRGGERALVVYHNRYARTRGWIRTSCAYAEKPGVGRRLVQQTLGEALGLSRDAARFLICRDAVTGLEYLRRSRALADEGLRLELEAYTCHVFLDWREVVGDGVRPWDTLAERLGGRGVPDVHEAMLMLMLEPVHAALRGVLDPALVASLMSGAPSRAGAGDRVRAFLAAAHDLAKRSADVTLGEFRGDVGSAVQAFEKHVDAVMNIAALEARFASPWPSAARALFEPHDAAALGALLGWCALEALGRACDPANAAESGARLFDSLRLRSILAEAEGRLGLEGEECWRAAARVRVALAHAPAAPGGERTPAGRAAALDWISDPDAAWLTGVNEYQGVRYFVKEPFERLVWWMALPALRDLAADPSPSPQAVRALEHDIAGFMKAAAVAGYRLP
jgi:hypothetical protein